MSRFGLDRQRRILFNWDGSDVLAFLKDDPTRDTDTPWAIRIHLVLRTPGPTYRLLST